MSKIAIERIKKDLTDAHTYIEQMMADVTDEVAAFQPAGTANPIAGTYAHLIFSEDSFTNAILKGGDEICRNEWKDKTGFSSPQPGDWEHEYPKWLREVKLDSKIVHDYAKAVFKSTEGFIDTLVDEDLTKMIDMSKFGMGERSMGDILCIMILGHANNIMGEISVLKGIQGLKGYPF